MNLLKLTELSSLAFLFEITKDMMRLCVFTKMTDVLVEVRYRISIPNIIGYAFMQVRWIFN